MPTSIVTLTTDFGTRDSYVAQMKGVILSRHPGTTLIDVTHEIPPQDIPRAAFLLLECAERFPPGTVHLVVVDPGVGTSRKVLAASAGDRFFVAPDNGVLYPILDKYPDARIVEVQDSEHKLPNVSNTFHGRDLMAPIAGALAAGVSLENLGAVLTSPPVAVQLPMPLVEAEQILGNVLWADSFGNLVTNITADLLPPLPPGVLRLQVGTEEIRGISASYGMVQRGMLLALIGSSDRIEIAVNQGSAVEMLGLDRGTPIRLTWPAD